MLVPIRPESSEETKEKLRELILYISEKCEKDFYFGMVKLNKIILRADRLAYLRYGKSITGTAYMRLPNGLVPLHMAQVLDEMKSASEIVVRERQMFEHIQKRVVPLRDAKLDNFTAKDIALIEEIIDTCKMLSGSDMSRQSHGTAWHIASHKDTIPYKAFLLSDNQTLTENDIEEGYALIKRHGWEQYATQQKH